MRGGGFVDPAKIISLEEAERQAAAFLDRTDTTATLIGEVHELRAENERLVAEVERLREQRCDLAERLKKADETLSTSANADGTSPGEWKRLHGKAEGVRLALSYLRESA